MPLRRVTDLSKNNGAIWLGGGHIEPVAGERKRDIIDSVGTPPSPFLWFLITRATPPQCCAGYLPELKCPYRPRLCSRNCALIALGMVFGPQLLEKQEAEWVCFF